MLTNDAFEAAYEAEQDALFDAAFGPSLWDADPGVCCAAFQLGACAHTEAAAEAHAEAADLAQDRAVQAWLYPEPGGPLEMDERH
jgi:hypothetical protein